jgi:hypothetical protein
VLNSSLLRGELHAGGGGLQFETIWCAGGGSAGDKNMKIIFTISTLPHTTSRVWVELLVSLSQAQSQSKTRLRKSLLPTCFYSSLGQH